MDELKEMQLQLNSLKEELSRKNIVNNRLIKKVISEKVSSINKIVWAECISYPIVLLVLLSFCVATHTNIWVAWSFGIVGLIDLLTDFRTLRISTKQIADMNLKEMAIKLRKQKEERRIQNGIGIPLMVCWCGWFFYEFVISLDLPDEAKLWAGIILGVICLTAVAIILGILFKKIEGTTSDMISEIDDMEEDA